MIQTIQRNIDHTLTWLNVCRISIFVMSTKFKLTIKNIMSENASIKRKLYLFVTLRIFEVGSLMFLLVCL